MGNPPGEYDEKTWGDETKCSHYPKSKILAEKKVWEFYEKNKNSIEVAVVNPSMVIGPGNTI
jgi:nucleoside-diphosphate-sugar epimerase